MTAPVRALTPGDVARSAIQRSLFAPTTLERALATLGFVQADPIRAPARAQDLILRHRVGGYRAGDLQRRYADLDVEEDYFLNYGFLPRAHVALMHPRTARRAWTASHRRRAAAILDFIRERGEAHPAEVEAHFSHGRVINAWGGTSRASTSLLDAMHYRGLLRIARRDGGVRVYAPPKLEPAALSGPERAARLLHLALALYGPVPERSLGTLAGFLRCGAPHLRAPIRAALEGLKASLPRARVDGVTWYWPAADEPRARAAPNETVRFLAPFDPLVWDRRRFELLWGWAYRFEAYTPVRKRVRGYYALPLLWRDEVIGWANVTSADELELGYVSGRAPRERAFRRALEEERERLRRFLAAHSASSESSASAVSGWGKITS